MKLCGFDIGLDRPFFLIAGPCVVESEQLQMDVAGQLKEITASAFCAEGLQKVRELNQICIRKNMSPGGAADLLAATIFLCRMETLMERLKSIT